MSRADQVAELYRQRPRDRFVRGSSWVLLALVAVSWGSGWLHATDLFGARRWANLHRFVTVDAWPRPLRGSGFEWAKFSAWIGDLWRDGGSQAVVLTLALSVASITLAACGALVLSFLATRTLAAREPFGKAQRQRGWRIWIARTVRVLCVLARAVPEYIWAFLGLALLPGSAWPIVLALALHNGGILARLGADTLENVETRAPQNLWLSGAERTGLAVFCLGPLVLSRMLAYVFYRWETCVREATVLGMLGVLSLGYFVQDARARQRYDALVFYVVLGGLLILLGDVLSVLIRRWLRTGESQTPERGTR